jgi:predicted nicotinamide N-methyase
MAGRLDLFAQLKARKPKPKPNPELQKSFEVFGKRLLIQEDPDGGVGGSVWEAATSLLKCVESQTQLFPADHFKGKRVLELGSGTGLGGLAVSLLGAEITLTDRSDVVDLLQLNADLNKEVCVGSVIAQELEW